MTDAAAMKQFTRIQPCVVEDWPDAHTVWLVVGNQQFCVTSEAAETKEDAEWMQAQLMTALAALVDKTNAA